MATWRSIPRTFTSRLGFVGWVIVLLKPLIWLVERLGDVEFLLAAKTQVGVFLATGWGTLATIGLGAFIIARAVFLEGGKDQQPELTTQQETPDKSIPAPDYVVIKTFSLSGLSVAIRASVSFSDAGMPDADIFLERISLGKPHCSKCKIELDEVKMTDSLGDFVQIGYECRPCDNSFNGPYSDLLAEIKGDIRRKYRRYWDTYRQKIEELTKPRKQ